MLTNIRARALPTGHQMGQRNTGLAVAALVGALLTGLALPVQATPVRTAHLELELVAGSAVTPGGRVQVALRQVIAPGWHTYWRNPGDAGEATQIDWKLPPGWTAGPIVWPTPERAVTGPLMNYVYSREVLLPSAISAPANAAPGTRVTLSAHASLLVCKDICVPEEATLAVDVPVSAHADPDSRWSSAIAATLAAAPRPAKAKALFEVQGNEIRLAVRAPAIAAVAHGAREADIYFYPFSGTVIDQAKPQRAVATPDGVQVVIPAGYDVTHGKGPDLLQGVLALGTTRAVEISATPGKVPVLAAGPDALVQPTTPPGPSAGTPVPAAAAAAATPVSSEPVAGAAAQTGNVAVAASGLTFPAAVALAFLGGLVLNLMPCVFPVLSMKAAALARHTEHPAAARAEGVAYLAGVVLSFVALAAALIAARHAGEAVGWGFQLQSPGTVAVLALVMLASALNLSGLFEFGISAQGTGADLASRPGLAGAFFTGVLAVVVAAPCTGPFMASTIGWALAQSEVTALAVFAALGVGLAAPFVALAFAPGLYRLMPRPGAWMEGLRKALAFPMYGAAAWLAWVFVEEAGSGSLPYLFAAALLLAFGFWLWGVSQRTQIAGNRAAAIGGAIGALGLAVVTLNLGPKPMAAASAVGSTGEVQAWTPTRPAELQAQGRPVFVDFTAAWCVTCKVNEAGALASPAVKAAFQKTGTIYLRADWTNRNAEIAHALQAQGRAGVPLYLVYSRRGGAPAILPQVLTEGDLLKALEAAGR
jgi:thiol:disulfide interchange protein DsbD